MQTHTEKTLLNAIYLLDNMTQEVSKEDSEILKKAIKIIKDECIKEHGEKSLKGLF